MRRKVILLLLTAIMLPLLLLGATRGKIKGKVTDRESGEALVGTNVVVVGTSSGATTDVNGEFTILNLEVGVYQLKASYVGYQSITVSNIRVNTDLTTEMNFKLPAEGVQIGAVTIVAERPLVNKSATNAVHITTSEDISSLPARGINNIIALSPGVVLQDNTVFIRGGRQDEVGFYLEGVSITNPMVGGRAVTLVQEAIEEIQVQAGGYTAEFGGANSGIVQQQFKTGSSNLKASVHYITDNISLKSKDNAFDGKKRLGTNWYGYNEFTGTLSGPVVDERFKFFGLFNYNYQRDQNPQSYPGVNVGKIGDPTTKDTIDLTYPDGAVRGNSLQQYNYTATLNMDFKPITVRAAGTFTQGTSFNQFSAARVAGNIANLLNGRTEQIDQINGSGSVKITHTLSPTTFYEVTGGYFRQTSNTFDPILKDNFLQYGDSAANARAGYVWTRTANDNIGPFARPRRLNIMGFAFNAPTDVVADYVKFKRENISVTGAVTTLLGSKNFVKVGGDFQRYTIRNYSFGNEGLMALPGLIDANNKLPAGDPNKTTTEQVLINRGVNNFGYDVMGNESDAAGFNGPKHPAFASAYVQDKVEYSDLVLNVGLRYDFINSDSKAFKDPEHPELAIDKTNGSIVPSGLVKVATFSSLSPRIGLSFPVTDRTVFHTQYGKFVQQSRLRDIYQGYYATGSNIRGGFFIPAPVGFDVRPTRTTQYELGFSQQLGDFASFDITGYYKDIIDQIVYDQQFTGAGSPFGGYFILKNGDFATTKGVEITFNMRRVKRLQINSSLAFQDAQGTGSFPNSNRGIVGAPLDGVTVFRPQYISPLEFNNSVRGNINIDYRFGKNDGPSILEQFGASALLTFNSGHPFTRGIGGADLEGDARDRQPVEPLNASSTPWVFQVDLRIDKSFSIMDKVGANIYIFVINLFDTRNIQNVFLRTGSTQDDGYLSDPSLGGQLINTYGPQYAALYRAVNIDYYEQYQNAGGLTTVPFFYGPPRQIRLGIRFDY